MTTAALAVAQAARHSMAVLIGTWSIMALAFPSSSDAMTRCGWFDNPTPGNATLVDRDGEWIIGWQGGHQAEGPWPRFGSKQWVRTGVGSAGYGCACLKVKADAGTQEVVVILSSRALPLDTCRRDQALKNQEPENPLK